MEHKQIHLDFHTSRLIKGVGSKFTKEAFREMLTNTKADSITCFAKCHHGNLYFETKLEEKHPYLEKDLLLLQNEVTRQLRIKMPIYISVGFDEYQADLHPGWIAINENGAQIKEFGETPFDSGWHWLCLNNEYPTKIEEVIADIFMKFKIIDGFFFDIVTQPNCCCRNCIEGMHRSGLNPQEEIDRYNYARKIENDFKLRITRFIRKHQQTATTFFNGIVWDKLPDQSLDAYSHLEIESLASGVWGYEHFPLVSKFASHLGFESVAMTGRFHKSWADFGGYKTDNAIDFECIRGALLCNAISIGDQLHPTGIIDHKAANVIQRGFDSADNYFHNSTLKPVHDVAIIIDKEHSSLFSSSVTGASRILMEYHILYDILDKNFDFNNYKLLILPDNIKLNRNDKVRLKLFCENGGKIIATYHSGLGNLIEILQKEEPIYSQDYIECNGVKYIAYQSGLRVKLPNHFRTSNKILDLYFERSYQHFSSHFQTPYEKESDYFDRFQSDSIIYFSHPYFSLYAENGNEIYATMIMEAVEELLEKTVTIDAPKSVYGEVQENDAEIHVTLLNYVPIRKGSVYTIDTAQECSSASIIYQGKRYVIPHFKGHCKTILSK